MLEAQSMEEGATPMTEDDRFEAVLGPEKSGYIRGRGVGPKPTTSTAGQWIRPQLEKENEELRREVGANRVHWESLERENSEMASRLESLESNMHDEIQIQVQAALQSQLTTFFQQMKELGQVQYMQVNPGCSRVRINESYGNSS